MSITNQLELAPISASIDNAGAWDAIAQRIASEAGLPPAVTAQTIAQLVASAVPLLFEADAHGNVNLLRGTFADPVIAQCRRNAGCLDGARPLSAVVHLVGVHSADGHPVLRAHVAIDVRAVGGRRTTTGQFWDLVIGAQVTTSATGCPNCGAPIATGELICGHCRADVRIVVEVPLVVSRLELY